MRRPLSDLVAGGDIDVVVLHHLFVVELRDILGEVPTILAEDNVESGIARKAYARPSHPVHRLRNWLMWRKLLVFERRWIRRFKVCIAVSDQDADAIRRMSPNTEVHIVPNGVNISQFASRGSERSQRTLLFFGTLSYGPNADGITWFCREVLPRVRNRIPEVELDITGIDPTPRIRQLASQTGVNMVGYVPDIRERLWSATATVVPLHVGGGTRLKILEAMAAECPVISTSIGADGLGAIDGKHLLIADEAEAFANAIVTLFASPKMRREMAVLGRKFVSEHYDWRTITPKLDEACRRAIVLNAEKGKQ
jgi:glycosyltransferase involved in cell wall biosynthesis